MEQQHGSVVKGMLIPQKPNSLPLTPLTRRIKESGGIYSFIGGMQTLTNAIHEDILLSSESKRTVSTVNKRDKKNVRRVGSVDIIKNTSLDNLCFKPGDAVSNSMGTFMASFSRKDDVSGETDMKGEYDYVFSTLDAHMLANILEKKEQKVNNQEAPSNVHLLEELRNIEYASLYTVNVGYTK